MSPLLALASLQTIDPYVQLGGALPVEPWEAVQGYVAQASHEALSDGEVAVRPPSFVPSGASPLSAQRAAVRQWATILTSLRRVSEAPYQPGAGRDEEGYAKVKSLVKFAAWGAHVRFAEGDRKGAVTILLDGLTLARRVRQGTTLDALVGTACESIVMGSFEEHLDQISLPECDRVRKFVDAYLAAPMVAPNDAGPRFREAVEDAPARWVLKGADPMLVVFAKTLTQIRLLRLHMRVEAYRWNHLKLPPRLGDAAPSEETEDPLTQEPYLYEPTGGAYKITSKGFADMGPMGLRYRRDPKLLVPDEAPSGAKP